MELHWECYYKKDNLEESAAILTQGTWLVMIVRFSLYDNNFYCTMKIRHLTSQEVLFVTSTLDKNEHNQNILDCKKYANIIAGSFLGQQHPYRDFPKNF